MPGMVGAIDWHRQNWVMARKIITAAEMDKMTPQERADVVDASIVRSRVQTRASSEVQAMLTTVLRRRLGIPLARAIQ
jgi:hypothetical protein